MENKRIFTKDELYTLKEALVYTKLKFENYDYKNTEIRKSQIEKIEMLTKKISDEINKG